MEHNGCNCMHRPLSFEGQEPGDEEALLEEEDEYKPPQRGHRYLSPHIEMQTVQFQGLACKEEDRELNELITQLHSLLVWDTAYARLHAWCVHCFPDVARDLPKPEYQRDLPVVAYSYQAAPALPLPTA
jgi:hypothetical protein